jgi:hypothetical protein
VSGGRRLLVVEPERIFLADAATGVELLTFQAKTPLTKLFAPTEHAQWGECLKVTPDGHYAITALREDGYVFVWDVAMLVS